MHEIREFIFDFTQIFFSGKLQLLCHNHLPIFDVDLKNCCVRLVKAKDKKKNKNKKEHEKNDRKNANTKTKKKTNKKEAG